MKRQMVLLGVCFFLVAAAAGRTHVLAEEAAIPADELWEDVVVEALDPVAGADGQWVLKGKNEATGYGSDYNVSSSTQVAEGAAPIEAKALAVGNKVHIVYEYDPDYRRVAKKIEKLSSPQP